MPDTHSRFQRVLLGLGKAVTYIIFTFLLLLTFSKVVQFVPLPESTRGFHFAIASLLAALCANWICMRWFEGTRLINIGLRWSGRNLTVGLAAGVSSALLVTVAPVLIGMATFQQSAHAKANAADSAILICLFFVAAANEELQVRGYLLQVMMRPMGLIPPAILTGLLFASGHLGNPNASKLGMVNTFLAGFVLACAFRASGDLWFPIGLHYGWNLLLAITGANVSGFTTRLTNFELVWKAGPLWSGGEYGPEGGVLTTIAFSLWLLWCWKAPLQRRVAWMLAPRPDAGPPATTSLAI